jgi:hypothetical protein
MRVFIGLAVMPNAGKKSCRLTGNDCQRPRRGHYGPGHTHLTPQRDNVARLSCSVSSRSEDITQ